MQQFRAHPHRLATTAFAAIAIGTAAVVAAGYADDVEFVTSIPMHDKGVATYYVTGSIGGVGAVEFMVDTGSGYTTINEEALTLLKAQNRAVYSRQLSGTLADGSQLTVPVYRLSQITIGDQCALQDVEAAVFPGRTRFILGMNTLKQAAPFAFVTEPSPQLALGRCAVVSL